MKKHREQKMLRSRERNTNIITIQYTDDAQTLGHVRKKERILQRFQQAIV